MREISLGAVESLKMGEMGHLLPYLSPQYFLCCIQKIIKDISAS